MPARSVHKTAKLKISEADVQQAVVLMLEIDGWRAIRTDPVSDRSRGKGFGEVGMPDYLFIRYGSVAPSSCTAQVLWIEFKAPGKGPLPHQVLWAVTETNRGALVLKVDDVDGFREYYKKSGLMRHQILS
jgi:hypothetical protein